ncbi:MAG: GatB/YqeY domain-containing protein [Bacteriovoracaceae bacterium]|nr:GatB/YqeY domain-containing protein [Bacteriovoracaceae bacterium]
MAEVSHELELKVNQDIKEAMKAGAKDKLSALRMLKSALIENKTATQPKTELDVLVAHYKKLKKSIDAFPAGHEQIKKIEQELGFLDGYMPQAMTESEVSALISKIIAGGATNLGMVMKALVPQIQGRFETKAAQQLVAKALGK